MQTFPSAAVVLVVLIAPGMADEGVSAQAERQADIRRALLDYRTARNHIERRVRAIQAMVELGPDGVEAAAEFLESELQRLGRPVADPPPTARLDQRIEQLRRGLAGLRAAPELSREQLQAIGLPALDELTVLWRRREAMFDAHYRKLRRAREQIGQFIDFVRQFQAEAGSRALPAADYVQKAEELLARASKPEDPEARRILEENAQRAPRLDRREVAGMEALNAMRMMCGLRPLLYDANLCDAARGHSADMEAHGFFSHDSPVPGKASPWDRAKLAGTTASGENIYRGSGSPADALRAWFLSPGHHKNMLSESNTRQGLGRVGRHWTQLFGR